MKRARRGKAVPSAGLELTRTEGLLAQILLYTMGDAGQQRKALALRAAGLSNVEIAKLLGTTAVVVAQVLYQARRDGVTSSKAKRPKGRKR